MNSMFLLFIISVLQFVAQGLISFETPSGNTVWDLTGAPQNASVSKKVVFDYSQGEVPITLQLELLLAQGTIPYSYLLFNGNFNASSLHCHIPSQFPSSNYTYLRAYFQLVDGTAVSIESDLFPTITNMNVGEQTIQITSPTFTTDWEAGSTGNLIQWANNMFGVPSVINMELWEGQEGSLTITQLGQANGGLGEASVDLGSDLVSSSQYCIYAWGLSRDGSTKSGFSSTFSLENPNAPSVQSVPPINILLPNSNSSWMADMVYNVAWTMDPAPSNVTIELWQYNQASLLMVTTVESNVGLDLQSQAPFFHYSWTVSDFVAPSNDYALRIFGFLENNGTLVSQVSEPFEIRINQGFPPDSETIEMIFTNPTYNSIWTIGDTQAISWTFYNPGNSKLIPTLLNLDLWTVASVPTRVMTIAEGIDLPAINALFRNQFSWTLPLQLPVNTTYYIVGLCQMSDSSVIVGQSDDFQVTSVAQGLPNSGSDGEGDTSSVSEINSDFASVVIPNEFTQWNLGSTHYITYDVSLTPAMIETLNLTMSISLWKGQEKQVLSIATSVSANSFAYSWTIPSNGLHPESDYTIRLSVDEEPGVFVFSPEFTLSN